MIKHHKQIKKPAISIVIPVFNEEKAVKSTVMDLIKVFKKEKNPYEIVIVNDGSVDKSEKLSKSLVIKNRHISLISHTRNQGYGATLKTGIKVAKFDWILIIDADGTYSIKEIPTLIKYLPNYDMVVGARIKRGANISFSRKLAKKIINLLILFLTGAKILDINSGMRIFRKDLAREFWHLFPDTFSFTSTIGLASHLKKYPVKYIPIDYYKRLGKSSIKPINFLYFLTLIIRLVVYFKPFTFFFWPGIVCSMAGFVWIISTIIKYQNITDSSVLLLLTGIQISIFGLIADLIVKNREKLTN